MCPLPSLRLGVPGPWAMHTAGPPAALEWPSVVSDLPSPGCGSPRAVVGVGLGWVGGWGLSWAPVQVSPKWPRPPPWDLSAETTENQGVLRPLASWEHVPKQGALP